MKEELGKIHFKIGIIQLKNFFKTKHNFTTQANF